MTGADDTEPSRKRVPVPPEVAGVTAPWDDLDDAVDMATGAIADGQIVDEMEDDDGPETYKALRRTRRSLTYRAAEYAEAYTPQRRTVRADIWERIRGPVREAGRLIAADPELSVRIDTHLHSLVRHGAWLVEHVGPVERMTDLLHADSLNRWVDQERDRDPSVADYRSNIRKCAPVLWPDGPWPRVKGPVGRRGLRPPYTPGQLVHLHADVRRQRTPVRRRRAGAVVTLGLGAGLDGRWVPDVTHEDVVQAGAAGVRVWVPEPDRWVPVLAHFAGRVLELKATTAPGESLLGAADPGTDDALGNIVRDFEQPGAEPDDPWADHPVLCPKRLRSTWLLHHVNAGTRLPELLAAAGLQGTGQLDGLVRHTDAWPGDRAVRHLVQARGRR